MQSAYEHCATLVRDTDKDRFLATLFAPAERRPALHALYAFDLEVARVRTLSRQPLPGEIRLQWWREVLQGERGGEAAANPVAAALNDALVRAGVAPALLLDLVEAREFDLYDDPMPTLVALLAYARRTAGTVVDVAARLLDPEGDRFRAAADQAGTAMAITEVLRHVAPHASRRQLYLPADLLQRHGVTMESVYAGTDTPGLRAVLADLAEQARTALDALGSPSSGGRERVAAAFLPVALVPLWLARIQRRDYQPFRTAAEPAAWRRQWALWRAARK